MSSYVYWLVSGEKTYIGATKDLGRRIRQHNREIKGGARRTRSCTWEMYCAVTGFRTWKEALQFEWAFRYHSRRCRSRHTRAQVLVRVSQRERWTSNSPPSKDVPLVFAFWPLATQ